MDNWVRTCDKLPQEGWVVDTKTDFNEGSVWNEQPLVLKGKLWFFPDMSMYVYYTPTHWKYKNKIINE